MWDSEDRRKYFELNNIDPYKVLGVVKGNITIKEAKKRYHLLAKECHPDKGKASNSLEFLLLKECFYFIKEEEEIIDTPQSRNLTLNELKDDRLRQSYTFTDNINSQTNIYNTNFEDKSVREKLFAVNDINFDEIGDIIEEKKTANTEYINCLGYQPSNLFKNRKKFNVKYFNEVFEASKELNKDVIKFDINDLGGTDPKLTNNLGEISYYNDIIVETKKDLPKNLADWRTIYKGTNMDNYKDKDIKKIVSEFRKAKTTDTLEDIMTLLSRKKGEKIPEVTNKLSFAEASIRFRESQLVSSREQLKKNKEYIKSKLSIYPENTRRLL
jgi:curved DNA-binding protein CbpA